MVKVGKGIYALPVSNANVVSDLALKKERIKTIQGEEVVTVRGGAIVVGDMAGLASNLQRNCC